ncbi:tetratricopeptide repeat-containing protein [Algoriphagus boritolerans]|uniref:tetratricopeptide repeat-containing protein n=1 Tax=Algoriphagus boritolerans TaxID=308111 RepID=UPI002FCE3D60
MADVYSKLGDYKTALVHYEKLTKIEKAGFSLRALEQYCNVTCKYWVEEYTINQKKKVEAIAGIQDAILRLNSLLALGETAERYSLLGSAYKRKLMVLETDKQAFVQALVESGRAYFKASEKSGFKSAYPINNAVQLAKVYELITDEGFPFDGKTKLKFSLIINDLENLIQAKPKEKKEYWDLVTDSNLLLSRILIGKKPTKENWQELTDSYQEVWKKAGSTSDKKIGIRASGHLNQRIGILKNRRIKYFERKAGKA